MRRELGQLSLADGLVERSAGRNRQLEKIAALVDWAAFERLLGDIYAAPLGRPSYGPVVLMKYLFLQQWYGLSDPCPWTCDGGSCAWSRAAARSARRRGGFNCAAPARCYGS